MFIALLFAHPIYSYKRTIKCVGSAGERIRKKKKLKQPITRTSNWRGSKKNNVDVCTKRQVKHLHKHTEKNIFVYTSTLTRKK